MRFQKPETMSDLTKMLMRSIGELQKAQGEIRSGARQGTGYLVGMAYRLSPKPEVSGLARMKADRAADTMAEVADALQLAEVKLREVSKIAARAVEVSIETEAALKAKAASGSKYRV